MRIAAISDLAAPTSPDYPGHGLGQATHRVATMLLERGHEVILYGSEGSAFAGRCVQTAPMMPVEYEMRLARVVLADHRSVPFDVFIDNTHTKIMTRLLPTYPIISVYHDILMTPGGKNPVLVSEGMKAFPQMHWARYARVIHHSVDAAQFPFQEVPNDPAYALFLGLCRDYKQPMLAVEACVLAGMSLVVAGTIPGGGVSFSAGTNVRYIGAVVGEARARIIGGASMLLQLGVIESFGLTTLEAMLCGTPVVGWPMGGTVDLLQYAADGYSPQGGAFVPVARNRGKAVADTMRYVLSFSRAKVAAYGRKFNNPEAQADAYEQFCQEVAGE